MQNKITKISTDIDYFFDKAIDKSESGDFESALELLRHAQQTFMPQSFSTQDIDIRLEIADLFIQMGLIDEAFREYLKLSGSGYYLDEIFFGLIKCATLKDAPMQASYYIKQGIELKAFDDGDDDPDGFDLEFLYEMCKSVPKRKFEVLSPRDTSRALDMAKSLLYTMDTALAREVLIDIPKNSFQYIESRNYLALLELSEGRAIEGIEICNKILKKEPNDIYALSTKISALNILKREKERDVLVKKLDGLNVEEWAEVSKVALCFCQINNSVLALKYLKRCLKYVPYDKDFLILKMLAEANLSEFREAKNTAVLLLIIYPQDSVISYYATDLDNDLPNAKSYNLMPELPQHIRLIYAKILDDYVSKATSPDDFIKDTKNNPQLSMSVSYAMTSGNSAIAGQLGVFLANSSIGYEIVKEYLSDTNFPTQAKKEIFVALLKKEKNPKKIHIVLGYQILWCKAKIPKTIKESMLNNAFAEVYGAMFFLAELNEKKLVKEATAMLKILEKKGITLSANINNNAIATVLACKVSSHKIFATINSACDVFGVSVEEYEMAEAMFL